MLEIMEEFREGEGYEKKRLVYSLCYYISYVYAPAAVAQSSIPMSRLMKRKVLLEVYRIQKLTDRMKK